MATITENIQTIVDCKSAIKQAIIEKGGEVGDLTTYADAIINLPSGGGDVNPTASKNDVTFYDYDGTIRYSYTAKEFLALTEMPPLPKQKGLICQEWNWSFEDAVEYVSEYGVLDVGATYITDDGKTRLYIRIAAEGRMDVPLYFQQTVANGVTIDWGDGSATETLSGTGRVNTTHHYNSIGDYMISLDVAEGGTLTLGHSTNSYCIMGSTSNNGKVYCNMLQKVEIGSSVTLIGTYAFSDCYSLASVVIPSSVTSIQSSAFLDCYCMAFCDFSHHTAVPTLANTNAFTNIPSDFKIIVPDNLYDTWIAATNWSTYSTNIIKKTDWDASKNNQ